MRTIKFRGKRIGFDKWLYFDMSHHLSDDTGFPPDFLQYQLDVKTVGQFTGLLDPNGVEIYEGDVLNYGTYTGNSELTGKPCNHVVKWDAAHGAFETIALYEKDATGSFLDESGEVIGSIHTTPELLKRDSSQ